MVNINITLSDEEYKEVLYSLPRGLKKTAYARMLLLEGLEKTRLKREGKASFEQPPLTLSAVFAGCSSHSLFDYAGGFY